MIIDHVGLFVSDYDASKRFYTKCLAPLEIDLIMEVMGWAGFGKNQKGEFWLSADGKLSAGFHIAFLAENRQQVDQFYKAALEAGGKDNGAPGIREDYHPDYYGAFVFDPDGNNVEAVCHKPE